MKYLLLFNEENERLFNSKSRRKLLLLLDVDVDDVVVEEVVVAIGNI